MNKRPPIFLVHGIWDSGESMAAVRQSLILAGWDEVHAIDLVPNDGRAALKELASQLDAFVKDRAPDGPIDIVGFSMGGLVSRTWLTLLCPPGRCRRFIAISAPHRGTLWARFSLRKQGVKDMRPQSRLIRDLSEGKIQADQIYCYRTPYDLMIMPSRPSGIPGAIERSFFAPSHRRMISQASVLRSLIEDLKN